MLAVKKKIILLISGPKSVSEYDLVYQALIDFGHEVWKVPFSNFDNLISKIKSIKPAIVFGIPHFMFIGI